jgi:hypothetical protein
MPEILRAPQHLSHDNVDACLCIAFCTCIYALSFYLDALLTVWPCIIYICSICTFVSAAPDLVIPCLPINTREEASVLPHVLAQFRVLFS